MCGKTVFNLVFCQVTGGGFHLDTHIHIDR